MCTVAIRYLGGIKLVREGDIDFFSHPGVVGVSKTKRLRLPLPTRLQSVVLQEGQSSHHTLRRPSQDMAPASNCFTGNQKPSEKSRNNQRQSETSMDRKRFAEQIGACDEKNSAVKRDEATGTRGNRRQTGASRLMTRQETFRRSKLQLRRENQSQSGRKEIQVPESIRVNQRRLPSVASTQAAPIGFLRRSRSASADTTSLGGRRYSALRKVREPGVRCV